MKLALTFAPALAGLFVSAPVASGQQTCVATEQQRVIADDHEADDRNGVAVAISGDTVVTGAWRDNNSGLALVGSGYIYVRNGTDWTQQAKLKPSDPVTKTYLGTAVALDGDTAVVASSAADAAYVWVRSGTTWTEQAKLTDPLGLGRRVALSGDTLVAVDGGSTARAIVFVRTGSTWAQQGVFPLVGIFDDGLSLSGDSMIVNSNTTARVYVRDGTTWSEQANLGPTTSTNGSAVAILGDRAVVGSPLVGGNVGLARVYERVGTTWSQTATLEASDGTNGDYFGYSVALADERVLVGARDATLPLPRGGFAFDTGAAYSFVPGVNGWIEQSKLRATAPINFENFASSLSVDGDYAVAGASFSYIPPVGARAGAAYVFHLADHEPLAYCTAGISASGCQANLTSVGVASASAPTGFVVSAGQVEGDKMGLFYFGTSGAIGNPWGSTSSYKCVALPAKRGALISSGGTSGACDGTFSYDLNARWAQQPPQNPGAGAEVQVQLWYRDPFNTGNKDTSYSDALDVHVCP
jgi:uncharacterized Zn-binding protein involved in type VI secretion